MSSDDADDERESSAPTPVVDWVNPKTLRFTVFVVQPNDEICTLRDLPSGVSVLDLKGRLEVHAGVPSQLYSLVYADGEEVPDDQKLIVKENILHGYILKMRLRDSWESLYQAVFRNNIEQVYHSGGVHLKGNIVISADESGRYEGVVKERGGVALYMASYLGHQRMVNMLVSVGVNPKSTTRFGRTPLHGAVAMDQVIVLELLVNNGATINQQDSFGAKPVDIAEQKNSVLCLRKLRLMQLNLRGNSGKLLSGRSKDNIRHPKRSSMDTPGSERTQSKLSQYSEHNSILKDSPQMHASRRYISSSAPVAETRNKHNPRDGTQSSMSNVTTGKIRNKHNVKWKDTRTEYTYWQVIDIPRKVEEAVKIKQMTYALPKTIIKFSELSSRNSATPEEGAIKKTDDLDKSTDRSTATLTPELAQAMQFSKNKLKYYKTLAKQPDEYVPMENRKHPYTRRQEKVGDAFKKWLERKEEEEEAANESDSSGEFFNQSDSEEDKMFAFNKRVRKMNRNNGVHSLTPGNRPMMNIMEFGSTVEGDGRNPPAEENLTAYNDWRRKRRDQSVEVPKIKTSKDYIVQRRRLEEKRQKLLLTAISYDEWLDHTEERKLLVRQILKADLDEMRRLEEARARDRQKLYSYDMWKDKLHRREMEDKRRREVQKQYDRARLREKLDAGRSTYAVPFDQWLNKKRSTMQKEKDVEKRIGLNGHTTSVNKQEVESAYHKVEKENTEPHDARHSSNGDVNMKHSSDLRQTLVS